MDGGYMRKIIETKNAPGPIGPYSQAVQANGFLFVSGQIPARPDSGDIVEGGIEEQTRQVMKNLSAVLEAADAGPGNVVKTTVFLTNLDDFSRFNQVYGEYFAEIKPARATVQVVRLPKGVLVEVEAIAAV
jgi:2-iminobutanoate/2-iminopropanoate deaminase